MSFGCGGGGQEMLAAERGLAERIVGYDRSPNAIQQARETSSARGFPNVEFEVGDPLAVELSVRPTVVLFTTELHRVPDLGAYLGLLRERLTPGGWVLANEYVGPSRFQFTDRQARIVEEILAILPDRLRWDYVNNTRKLFAEKLPLSYMEEEAPREAVSSEAIAATLERHFDVVTCRGYGGTILNPLLSRIVGNFDPDAEADVAILRLLAYVERLLISEAGLPNDFAVFAARRLVSDASQTAAG